MNDQITKVDGAVTADNGVNGALIQLIRDNNKNGIGLANQANALGLADAVNDEVMDAAWMGHGTANAANVDGYFTRNRTIAYAAGDVFFVRMWSAPSAGYNVATPKDSLAPATWGGLQYFDVAFTALSAVSASFNVNQPGGTGTPSAKVFLQPVPEPATLALFGLGMVALAVRRIRK